MLGATCFLSSFNSASRRRPGRCLCASGLPRPSPQRGSLGDALRPWGALVQRKHSGPSTAELRWGGGRRPGWGWGYFRRKIQGMFTTVFNNLKQCLVGECWVWGLINVNYTVILFIFYWGLSHSNWEILWKKGGFKGVNCEQWRLQDDWSSFLLVSWVSNDLMEHHLSRIHILNYDIYIYIYLYIYYVLFHWMNSPSTLVSLRYVWFPQGFHICVHVHGTVKLVDLMDGKSWSREGREGV